MARDTLGMIANHKIVLEGALATCRADIVGQHWLGDTEDAGGERRPFFLIGRRYAFHLTGSASGTWQFARLALDVTWHTGDRGVFERASGAAGSHAP